MPKSPPDILLALCPPWGVVNPPLGLAYLATNLKQRGFKVDICDLNLNLYRTVNHHFKNLWQIENDHQWRNPDRVNDLFYLWKGNINRLLDDILDSHAAVIGFSIVDPNEYISSLVIKALKQKKPNRIVIAGGPGCSSAAQRQYLLDASGNAIDYFVLGEGEFSLAELLRLLPSRYQANRIQGVVTAGDTDNFSTTAQRPDLDKIAFPTFEEFSLPDYGQQSLAVMWSRGCVGRCVYCKERALWGKYRIRPLSSIIDELHHHVRCYAIQNFVIYDSAVNGNPRHLEDICDAIISSPLEITWSAEAGEKLLQKMRRAGCHTLVLGIESGSDNVLLKMGKLNKTPTAEKVLKRAKGAGITVAINIMIGFPGEHQQDFEDTLEFLRRNQPWIDRLDSVSTVQIVDNTPLMQKAVQLGVILPERNPHNRWYTLDGNTIEERQRRLRIVLESAQELGIEIGRTFLETETTKKLDLKYDNNPQRMWRRWLNRLGYLTWN
jgi:radical SAM superfamily enzyme YgiQ (UPF0313 family)